jgi:hypothetical protein
MKEKIIYFIFSLFFVFATAGIFQNKAYKEKIKDDYISYNIENLELITNDTPFPNNNFIFLERHILTKSGAEMKISSASGIALKSLDGRVWGMTVAHFCIDEEEKRFISDNKIEAKISNRASIFGNIYQIDNIVYDRSKDLCVFSFLSEHKVKTIKWAKKYPKVGEKIFTSSAPLGLYSHELRMHFEGRFGGCQYPGYCFYTIPGIMGSSGSGVIDKQGNIVSIIAVSVTDFNEITGGAKLEDIIEMYVRYIP